MLKRIPQIIAVAGALMFAYGMYLALVASPADHQMGEVARLMHVHVPAVWMALIAAIINVVCCIWYLFNQNWKMDAMAEASAEVGLLFGTYGLVLGAIWGKPTWGVYWTWDPRLTSTAIMLVAYAGYLALRKFVDDPEKRATWSAVVGILAFIDIPIVWFSVRWWKSLHQVQSSSQTVDKELYATWLYNAAALAVVTLAFLIYRYKIAKAHRAAEVTVPPTMPTQRVGLTPTGSES